MHPRGTGIAHPDPIVVHRFTDPPVHPEHANGQLVTHTEHVLGFSLQGHGVMDYGEEVTVHPGSLVLIPAGVPHRTLPGPPSERWAVGFCASCLGLLETHPLMAPFAAVRRGAVPVLVVEEARRSEVDRAFAELAEEVVRAAPESFELARARLCLLLGEVTRAHTHARPVLRSDSLVDAALEYIRAHALTGISLHDVAKAVHRTPSHVAATVKKETGYTVGAWITSARLADASTRLLHTDASLDEITERSGWADKTHFIRQFKKAFGQTPAAWRRARRTETP